MSVNVLRRREVEHERYESYRQFEELTDISERLSIPIETTLEFFIHEAQVYAPDGKRVVDVVQDGYNKAVEVAKFNNDWVIEAQRCGIELDESHQVEQLANGTLDGNTLIIDSPAPDVVKTGKSSIRGYNRDKLRCMVRIWRKNKYKVSLTTLSLDQSDYQGLQAVHGALDDELPMGLSSEDILARRRVLTTDAQEAEWLPSIIREAYDKSLKKTKGKVFYGGSRFAGREDALSYINRQTDLVAEHFEAIAAIVGNVLNKSERDDQLEQVRQRTAAAIDARAAGQSVGSLSDDVVSDKVASGDYSGTCPPSTNSAEKIGMLQGKSKVKKCPICHTKNVVAEIKNGFISGSCGCSKEICGEKVIRGNKNRRTDSNKDEKPKVKKPEKPSLSKEQLIKSKYGPHAIIQSTIVVGGVNRVIIDRRNNQVIAKF